ncbi:MAG: Uma2 family endonuclease [Planctomycetaceae bacterium]
MTPGVSTEPPHHEEIGLTSTAVVRRFTVDEYLAIERDSETKHEYYAGQIFAMAGASEAHNLVSGNLIRTIGNHLVDRDCRLYPSDMRVVLPTGLYTYPDATVVCGPRDIEMRGGLDTLKNPTLLVEVLSKSTEAYDLGVKFDHYRTIRSLEGYLLLRQDRARAYHYRRQEDGSWNLTTADGLDSAVSLPEIGLTLPLTELFSKVDFPPVSDDFEPDLTPPESHPAGPWIR